jgi:hypothetical protein
MSSAHPALRIWHAIWSRQKVFFSHGFLKELLVCIVLWLKVVVCCVQEAWSEPNYDSKKRDGYLQNIFRCFWRFYLVFFFFLYCWCWFLMCWSVGGVLTAGQTTGTPIHVFVPNTDQRGFVSIYWNLALHIFGG